jgi:hypothetical protein
MISFRHALSLHVSRFCFRFFFVYCLLFCGQLVLLVVPIVSKYLESWWLTPVQWVARGFFGRDYTIEWMPYESKDTTFNYLQVFIIVCCSLVVAAAWTLVDRKARPHLQAWLRVMLRYYVGLTMTVYGLKMVVDVLYPYPEHVQLLYTFAETTRYGLLANFLGTSRLLQSFLGLCVLTGGTLLLFRRTRLLGALITGVILLNILVLVFSQDVPLKLLALHLFAFTFLLILPDIRFMVKFFVLHLPSKPVSDHSVYPHHRRKFFLAGKALFIVWFVFIHSVFILDDFRKKGDGQVKPYLTGLHDVDIFVLNNDTLPPLLSDHRIWKKVEMYGKHYAVIYTIDDQWHRYYYQADSTKGTLSFSEYKQPPFAAFNFTHDEHFIYLKGHIQGDTAVVDLRKNVEKNFAVNTPGFRWIQDFVVRQ